jgi:hypothetical protein
MNSSSRRSSEICEWNHIIHDCMLAALNRCACDASLIGASRTRSFAPAHIRPSFGSHARCTSLERAASKLDPFFRPLITAGVGYHHGGMGYDQRRVIEELFANSDLRVVWSAR